MEFLSNTFNGRYLQGSGTYFYLVNERQYNTEIGISDMLFFTIGDALIF